jgi:hypothetical protein
MILSQETSALLATKQGSGRRRVMTTIPIVIGNEKSKFKDAVILHFLVFAMYVLLSAMFRTDAI